jgi:exopolysaccharide production protein ExoZ
VIYNLQYMRALAALLVVFYHGQSIWNQFAVQKMALFDAGAGGVDVFFVISGLIMWVTTCVDRRGPGAFIRNRLIRIVPLYWLMTGFKLALALALPFLTDLQLDPAHVAASFAFIAWPEPGTGIFAPLLQPGWTLNLEMFFYAAFAAALLLPVRFRPLAICGFLALCTVAGLGSVTNSYGGFYGSAIMLEFAAGIMLAAYIAPWALRLNVPRLGYAAIALVGLVWLLVAPWQQAVGFGRLWVWGVPALLLVGGAYLHERAGKPLVIMPLAILGNASYALYLVHPFAVTFAGVAWRKLALPTDGAAAMTGYMALVVLLSLCGGVVVWFLVERPIARWLKQQSAPAPVAQPS